MIPPFLPGGHLPPGIHWAGWDEVVARLGVTDRRRRLLAGLALAIADLRAAGCQAVYVDGSFVTSKAEPNDFDACWDRRGVDRRLLNPVPLTFDRRRATQKARYGGELFPADAVADHRGTRFLEFFQFDNRAGRPKGIIAIDLGSGHDHE